MKGQARFGRPEMHGRILTLAQRPRYLVVDKDSMEDERLSLRARGLLAYLLCKPPDWIVVEKVLVNHLAKADKGEGRDAIRTAMSELKTHGYFRRTRRRNIRGQFVYITVVFESPQIFEERYRQGHLWESFMLEIVPGSTAEEAEDEPPPLFRAAADRRLETRQRSVRRGASRPAQDAEGAISGPPAVDGFPGPGFPSTAQPSTGNPTLLNPEPQNPDELKTHKSSSSSPGASASRNAGNAAAAGGAHAPGSGPLRDALLNAGIGEPKLSELAAKEHLTPTIVAREAAEARARGKGTGALVRNLEAAAERAAAAWQRAGEYQRRQVGAATAASPAQRSRAEQEQHAAEEREIERALNALPADELARRAEEVGRKFPRLRGRDLSVDRVLRYLIFHQLRSEAARPEPIYETEADKRRCAERARVIGGGNVEMPVIVYGSGGPEPGC